MYKIQRLPVQAWAANQRLDFNCETLQSEIGGAPLHVAEVVVLGKFLVDNSSDEFPGYLLGQVFAGLNLTPNEPCESSSTDGHAQLMQDWMLTGRRPPTTNIAVAVDPKYIEVAVRFPFHGCLLGAKAGEYSDFLRPVASWKHGSVSVTCSAAQVNADYGMTITSGNIYVLFVTEPLPGEFHMGPTLCYDLYTRPAGGSFNFPAKGRVMSVALCPLDADTTPYTSVDMRDACWVQGLTRQELAHGWQAMQAFGLGNEPEFGDTLNLEFLPILFNRPCSGRLWTSLKLERGNRTVDVVNTSQDDFRVMTVQVMSSAGSLRRLVANVGLSAAAPAVTIRNAADRIRAGFTADVLPRSIPLYKMLRGGNLAARKRGS